MNPGDTTCHCCCVLLKPPIVEMIAVRLDKTEADRKVNICWQCREMIVDKEKLLATLQYRYRPIEIVAAPNINKRVQLGGKAHGKVVHRQ